MSARAQEAIETLNGLFAALFRPGEGERPIIRQPQRPLREELFEMFFPDALVRQYADRSKSNLTWFFTSDARNKSIRRSLLALLREDARGMVEDAHRKCRQVLWPRPGHAVFDAPRLRQVLESACVPAALQAQWVEPRQEARPARSRLDVFFDADEAAALSRMILTLAVAGDATGDVLNELWRDDSGGCAFMLSDDSAEGGIRYCRMLDLQGRSARAFEGFERIARQLSNRPAQTADESMMYCRLGEMLFTGEGCARDERAAQAYDRLGCLDENPKSWYQLAQHTTGTPAREALERAARLGYGPAILQLGMAWFNGSARLACLRSTDSARRWFQRGMSLPGGDGAECANMLGQLHEALGEREAAARAYRVAQENGSAEAAERLARLDWALAPTVEPASAKQPAGASTGCCLVNDLSGCNRRFLDGLRGRWDVTVCGAAKSDDAPRNARLTDRSPQDALRDMAQGVYWGGAPQFPPLLIALMSDDRQRNLYQAAALLGELQRLARSLGERAWDLVDQAELYVLAGHDEGELLLDAAFAGMGPLYFRVRLCDPAQDAADRLFSAAPLFLPRLRAAGDTRVALKLIGCGEEAMAALRRAVALPLPEAAKLSVDVYGESAQAMARRFRQLAPGWRDDLAALCAPSPCFHECAPEEALADMPEGFADGDYYVVADGDDARNLLLGARLRGALMRRDPGAERRPFIAVHTAHPVAQWLGGGLSAGPGAADGAPPWCARYELFPFGGLDMYAPDQLRSDPLECRARQAHMLTIGLPNTRDARHTAMGSYYRRQFNRDMARLEALSLAYRMHLAGLDLAGWRLYGVPEEEARLGADYTQWLRDADHLHSAVRDEHTRRCRALLSLGWCTASLDDVSAWVRRGNPGHILYPARLNPFICPWEALEESDLPARVRELVRACFPEKSVPDPRRVEEASVRDTERVLGE